MEFKKVDPKEYIQGKAVELFIKATPVKARKAFEGEAVVAMVKDKETGALMPEHDPHIAVEGDWVVKNKGGEIYLVSNEEFHRIYGPSEKEGERIPEAKPRKCVRVAENICFEAPWGGEMRIQEGGYLNIDNMDGIYGINPEEFKETHMPAPEKTK